MSSLAVVFKVHYGIFFWSNMHTADLRRDAPSVYFEHNRHLYSYGTYMYIKY